MRLVTSITFKNDKPGFPPAYTRLSDELVYLATKFLTHKVRGKNYPYDFLDQGDIRRSRVPSGVGPLVWAHGLPHFPVYKGYYILCGRKHAKWVGWLMNTSDASKKKYPMWTIGAVVAPESALGLLRVPRITERQLRVHKPRHTRDVENGSEKSPSARDVVQKVHYDHSIVPRNSSGGYRVLPICQIPGYQIRVGPNWHNGRLAEMVSQEMFSAHGMESFDYVKASEKVYSNQLHPQAEIDGLSTAEEDAGDGMSQVNSSIDESGISDAADYADYYGDTDDFDYTDDESLDEEEEDSQDEMESSCSAVNDEICQVALKDHNCAEKECRTGGYSRPSQRVAKASKSPPKAAQLLKANKPSKSKTTARCSKVTKRVTRSIGITKRNEKALAVIQAAIDKNLIASKKKVNKTVSKKKGKRLTPDLTTLDTDEKIMASERSEISKMIKERVTEAGCKQPGQQSITQNPDDSEMSFDSPEILMSEEEEYASAISKQSIGSSAIQISEDSEAVYDWNGTPQVREDDTYKKAVYLAGLARDAIKKSNSSSVKLEVQEIEERAMEL